MKQCKRCNGTFDHLKTEMRIEDGPQLLVSAQGSTIAFAGSMTRFSVMHVEA